MKIFFLLTLISLGIFLPAQSLTKSEMRLLYLRATEHKPALDSLFDFLDELNNPTPVQECYNGICYALYTQHDKSTWAKLRHVLKSKDMLNSSIARDPKDPELRFMRFSLEHFLPSFLGLNKHIPDDLKVIFDHPHFIDESPDLKKKAIEFLLWTQRCTPQQTKTLNDELSLLNKKA